MSEPETGRAVTFNNNPFSGPFPEEVPLSRAPLVRVLAQIRFVDVLKIKDEEFIADFQERLRKEYPDFNLEQTSKITMGPSGPQKVEQGKVWRFSNLDGNWRVSLEPNFVALETLKYVSRGDFLERLERVLAAVREHFEPAFARRVGVRYVDRIVDPEFSQVSKLVRNEMLGIVRSDVHEHTEHTISQAIFTAPEGKLNARWGMLPPEGVHDPMVMEPVEGKSWILDIDVFHEFSEERAEFEVGKLTDVAHQLATRAYTFFRWSVTDEFLKAYGREL